MRGRRLRRVLVLLKGRTLMYVMLMILFMAGVFALAVCLTAPDKGDE